MGANQSKPNSDTDSASGSKTIDRLKRASRAFKKPRSSASSRTSTPAPTAPTPAVTAASTTPAVAAAAAPTPTPSATSASAAPAKQSQPPPASSPPASAFIMPPPTVPCQYRTGKTLGSGTYAIVKEAIHITTGKYYACKVINKKLMEGREHMVRNEIAVLKRISSGHRNIVTLHDYFETAHNLYLCFDLCTGGELFDRICAKGNYYEADAAALVRTIFKAVKYIHDAGIVHRDLKPENLLFKTQAEEADIMIADFGLSRVMEEEKLNMLTEICGTPGYMAPEIFKRTGHGKPVDVWAMGVITYFLLAGYTPFDRDSQQQEMEAIIAGDYKFEPEEYWANVSETAKDFVRTCLTIDPKKRPTAAEALTHKWLAEDETHFVTVDGRPADLLPNVKRAFNAKATWKKAAFGIRAMNRMATLASAGLPTGEREKLKADVNAYKEESEKEEFETAKVTYQGGGSDVGGPKDEELAKQLAQSSLEEKKD